MELLLVQDVQGLGARGEIVDVARGYARNYLLPKGLAKVPTPQLVTEVKAKAAKQREESEAHKAQQMEVAKDLAAVALTVTMKASEEGHLYGSVGARQISELLVEQGFDVDEKHVHLEQPLKEVGEFDVQIAVHPEVTVPVKVTVVAEES
jgi:large subunit ribosomal protein L9